MNSQDTEISCQECVYETLITIGTSSFKDENIFSEMCLLFYPVKRTVLRLWNFSDQLQISILFKHQKKKKNNHSISTDLIIIKNKAEKSVKSFQIANKSEKAVICWEVEGS